MKKNLKQFIIKSAILMMILLGVTFLFRFPIDYYNLAMLSMNKATRIFSKSDALKIMGLAVLFFTLYFKKQIGAIKHEKQNMLISASLIISGVLVVAAYYFLRYLANINGITACFYYYMIIILSLLILMSAFTFFAVGVFSFSYLKIFYGKFKKELGITLILSVIAYNLLMFFQNLWPYFSSSIARILYWMFSPFYPTYLALEKTPILDVNGFVVSIGAPCSGIESLFLFAAFSIGIFVLDHERLKTKTFILSSIVGLIGIYFVNILRLFLLLLTGIYINPDFAVGMFHTNVGWVLFVIYFLIYYYIVTKFIYKKRFTK